MSLPESEERQPFAMGETVLVTARGGKPEQQIRLDRLWWGEKAKGWCFQATDPLSGKTYFGFASSVRKLGTQPPAPPAPRPAPKPGPPDPNTLARARPVDDEPRYR